ncbi:MAG: DUF1294 domain-containing protein [Verrucomicrobiota bacterium]
MKIPDSLAATWFIALSAATFIAFGYDKWCASRFGRRVPESFLILLRAPGGWPGGVAGMSVFRHKTVKWMFKLKYAPGLIPFAVEFLAWLHWR